MSSAKSKGTEYPDEWVIAGNHRDAWVYGAVDPPAAPPPCSSRCMASERLLKQGWRPKRTIVFCQLGRRGRGPYRSTEWVEAARQGSSTRRCLLQHGCSSLRPDFSRRRRSFAQTVPPRTHPLSSSPQGGALSMTSGRESAPGATNIAPSNAPPVISELAPIGDLGSAPTHRPFSSMWRAFHRRQLRRALRCSTTHLRQLCLVHPKRRSPLLYLQEMARVFASRLCACRCRRAASLCGLRQCY